MHSYLISTALLATAGGNSILSAPAETSLFAEMNISQYQSQIISKINLDGNFANGDFAEISNSMKETDLYLGDGSKSMISLRLAKF